MITSRTIADLKLLVESGARGVPKPLPKTERLCRARSFIMREDLEIEGLFKLVVEKLDTVSLGLTEMMFPTVFRMFRLDVLSIS